MFPTRLNTAGLFLVGLGALLVLASAEPLPAIAGMLMMLTGAILSSHRFSDDGGRLIL